MAIASAHLPIVLLLAIFAAVVVVNIQGADKEARVTSARQVIQVISKQINVYRQVNDSWPATINSDIDGTNDPAKWHPVDKTSTNFPLSYDAANGTKVSSFGETSLVP